MFMRNWPKSNFDNRGTIEVLEPSTRAILGAIDRGGDGIVVIGVLLRQAVGIRSTRIRSI